MEPSGASAPLVGVEELVRRAQRGDAVALDGLVQELEPYVGRICASVALDAAEDATQETLIAVVRNLRTLREPRALRGWVRRIAVREAIRSARGGRRSTPVDPADLELPSLGDTPTGVEIRAVLSSLTPEQRAVLVLRHLDDLTEAEMAHALGVAGGTVKSRLHRARAAFREAWSG